MHNDGQHALDIALVVTIHAFHAQFVRSRFESCESQHMLIGIGEKPVIVKSFELIFVSCLLGKPIIVQSKGNGKHVLVVIQFDNAVVCHGTFQYYPAVVLLANHNILVKKLNLREQYLRKFLVLYHVLRIEIVDSGGTTNLNLARMCHQD